MISFQIKDVKNCMAKLLASDTFDSFQLVEATITTYNTFIIDGHLVKEFFNDVHADEDDQESALRDMGYSNWSDMRTLCFDLIKGKKTPVNFKFILQSNPATVASLLQNGGTSITPTQLKAFILNVKYENGNLHLITAVSYQTFLLDKSADAIWDTAIKDFLTKHRIDFDCL